MDPTVAAYIAGVMDGEGCFRIWKGSAKASPLGIAYRATCEVTMCEKEVIEFISCMTGRKIKRSFTLPSGRVAYHLQWQCANAAAFIRQILPYLHGKRAEAMLCLQFQETVAPGRGHAHTEQSHAAADALYLACKQLKKPNANVQRPSLTGVGSSDPKCTATLN
jgi:hypothetical protein